jgi:hypothetical protein
VAIAPALPAALKKTVPPACGVVGENTNTAVRGGGGVVATVTAVPVDVED